MVIKTGGRAGGVRDNIVLQPLNGLPELAFRISKKAHDRAKRFFCARRIVTAQWWAEWGLLRKRRGLRFLTGTPTPLSSPPQIGVCGGDSLTKGAHL